MLHRHLFALALSAACLMGGPNTVLAQSLPDAPLHQTCRDPHLFPVCGSYLLVEGTVTLRLAGSRIPEPDCVPSVVTACMRDALLSYAAMDVGWMMNRGPKRSEGMSFQVGGGEEGVRLALRLRERLWLAPRLAADFSVGPMTTQIIAGNAGTKSTFGATADAGLTLPRVGGVLVGVDVASQEHRTVAAIHLGSRFESRGLIVPTIVTIVGSVLVWQGLKNSD